MIVQMHFSLCEDFRFHEVNSNNPRRCYDGSPLLEVLQLKSVTHTLNHIAAARAIVVIVPSGAVKHKNDREFLLPRSSLLMCVYVSVSVKT